MSAGFGCDNDHDQGVQGAACFSNKFFESRGKHGVGGVGAGNATGAEVELTDLNMVSGSAGT